MLGINSDQFIRFFCHSRIHLFCFLEFIDSSPEYGCVVKIVFTVIGGRIGIGFSDQHQCGSVVRIKFQHFQRISLSRLILLFSQLQLSHFQVIFSFSLVIFGFRDRFFQITFGFIEFLTFQEHDSQAISRISSRIQLVQLLSYSCI